MLDQLDRRLSDDAYDRVVQYIMSGALPAGAIIQERPLAEELGLSRTPLRDALLLLEGEGLLVREGKRLLRVVSMDITRYMENLAIRRLLECEAARLAVGRIDPQKLDEMEATLNRMLSEYDAGQLPKREEVRRIDEALHGTIAAAAGNTQLAAIENPYIRPEEHARALPGHLPRASRYHRRPARRVKPLSGGRGRGTAHISGSGQHHRALAATLIPCSPTAERYGV
jgi:DNA-binding GntR family transcriptional regulator